VTVVAGEHGAHHEHGPMAAAASGNALGADAAGADASGADVHALEVTVTAPVVSFRDPVYAAVARCLPCPPPATVGGMLAAAAGGWDEVPVKTTFAMTFHAGGAGIDLETYHPLDHLGGHTEPTPRDRHFLARTRLVLWLFDDIDRWAAALRRPVWPLRLGRSQDLVAVTARAVLLRRGDGRQAGAVVPAGHLGTSGRLLQLPTAISIDRARTRWDGYRYRQTVGTSGRAAADPVLPNVWVDEQGQAVVPLPSSHPATVERGAA
jgi:CRISPR-associated Cas5-like protein